MSDDEDTVVEADDWDEITLEEARRFAESVGLGQFVK